MRHSFTAVVERNIRLSSEFTTEPYEACWAAEARWFIHVLEATAGSTMIVSPQVSPDGLFWCDEGSPPLVIDGAGLYTFPLQGFGCWLRLRGELQGEAPCFRVIIYLVLKA